MGKLMRLEMGFATCFASCCALAASSPAGADGGCWALALDDASVSATKAATIASLPGFVAALGRPFTSRLLFDRLPLCAIAGSSDRVSYFPGVYQIGEV